MVYCREGSATLVADGEEDTDVTAGQIVMVSDGSVRWTKIPDGGVTLLSTTTTLEDDEDNSGPATSQDEDLSLKEGAALLAAGLAFGGLISVGTKLIAT